jgi:hypothetical protein
MTPDEIVGMFLRAQDLLIVVDDRVQLLEARDMETITRLCFLVEESNRSGDTPAQLALTRLAMTTAAALTTSVIDAPDNPQIIAEWRSAQDEYALLTAQAG